MNKGKIEEVLLKMSVPCGIKGFPYIVDAMEIFDKDGTDISMTKELYSTIAKKNKTTPSRVERAIRHAFEVTRNRNLKPELIKHYVGIDNCANANSLKMLYTQIKKECEEIEKKEIPEKESEILEIRKIIREELEMFLHELRKGQI